MKRLSIIIVSYNVKHYLYQCLDSIEKAVKDIDAEVFVVDNHSSDSSIEFLQPIFPDVHYIKSPHNLGFSKANNLAIRQAQGEYILLLNPDTIITPQAISNILSFMDCHKDAGAAGACMINGNGLKARESRRGLPSPMTAFYKMSGLCSLFPKNKVLGHYYMGDLPWDKPVEIEVISGAFFFCRAEALKKVGTLDEDFFMYGEDIDLSYRIMKGGYKNWYLPETILHYKGESTQKSSFRYVHVFYEAMFIFLRKHYGTLALCLSIPIKLAIYCKAITSLFGVLIKKMKKELGFVTPMHSSDDTHFVFIGKKEMTKRCGSFAETNGLAYTSIESEDIRKFDMNSIYEDTKTEEKDYIMVYDSSCFSYPEMLCALSQSPSRYKSLGIYHERTNVIIIPHEIISL